MKFQSNKRRFFSRLVSFCFAVVLSFSLCFSSFAASSSFSGLNGFTINNNGTFSMTVDGVNYRYYFPESAPVEADNYFCVVGYNPYSGDLTKPIVLYYTFLSDNFMPSIDSVTYPLSGGVWGIKYSTPRNQLDNVYVSILEPNNTNSYWANATSVLNFDFGYAYGFVCSSIDITMNGVGLVLKANNYSAAISGNGNIGAIFGTDPDILYYLYPGLDNTVNTVIVDGLDGYALIYGFFDGMWSGVWQGYEVLANGITIGGVSLGTMIVTLLSLVIILGVVLLIVKIIRG